MYSDYKQRTRTKQINKPNQFGAAFSLPTSAIAYNTTIL
ncbi:hypothetical protein NIES2104_49350 [Leptolyngbya sp. NIES-2104]|nr:hypothetical protein NIES2104_49350 [Leptolyngbya sp. NIES-2104]